MQNKPVLDRGDFFRIMISNMKGGYFKQCVLSSLREPVRYLVQKKGSVVGILTIDATRVRKKGIDYCQSFSNQIALGLTEDIAKMIRFYLVTKFQIPDEISFQTHKHRFVFKIIQQKIVEKRTINCSGINKELSVVWIVNLKISSDSLI